MVSGIAMQTDELIKLSIITIEVLKKWCYLNKVLRPTSEHDKDKIRHSHTQSNQILINFNLSSIVKPTSTSQSKVFTE